MPDSPLPTDDELRALFFQKYGHPDRTGWAPRRRFNAGYFTPADVYEACVYKNVQPGIRWLDAGGGHTIFRNNAPLARQLVDRCQRVVAVDPDRTVQQNALAHETAQCLLEDYEADQPFDLVTCRMVVEHVEQPERFVSALARLIKPGGCAIILTVNLHAPVTWASRMTPFWVHNLVKGKVWGEDEENTFPVRYHMNTRATLEHLFEAANFTEQAFAKLDDLSAFHRFYKLNYLEVLTLRACRRLRLHYPETCLLGVYRRLPDAQTHTLGHPRAAA